MKAPLRKVTGRIVEFGTRKPADLLECGHTKYPRWVSERATKRRCEVCAR